MLNKRFGGFSLFYRKSGIYIICIAVLFFLIGLLTTIAPAYRLSSETISRWTSDIDSSSFLYLMGMENRGFQEAYPKEKELPKVSTTLFHIMTNIKPSDPRSLLGQELPGFDSFGSKIIVAGEGTDYANLTLESSPPLDEVLKDRHAISGDEDEEKEVKKEEPKKAKQTTGNRKVAFIYNTHNREAFLPQMPSSTKPDEAYHKSVNISKVSARFEKRLQENGLGTARDNSDFMSILNKRGWGYGQSYAASRSVVEAAVSGNKDLEYIFDIHRDSLPRQHTTKTIKGKGYGQIMFVVGADHPNYEKNLRLATKLHYKLEEKYKGLSRGVIQKAGAGTNGIFNQDLSGNAVLVEIGGYENSLDEVYRTADVLAEVFSEYYWNAEKVNAK
ncbi:stage II sporulation protein P [Aciduricibacillus chroicocephali]|uniref:Stage II sporulation protein P n=1 Tax=Aciduricibacillus chroicocephali TaxID=3054939 RepID=A0ABY9KST3_9BACI|nr:stage II sporulation protein P [Bacillaceae bacterium 44XB]